VCRKHDRKTDLLAASRLSCLNSLAVGEGNETIFSHLKQVEGLQLQRKIVDDGVDK